MNADGRVHFYRRHGFLDYWGQGVDILLFIVREEKHVSWVDNVKFVGEFKYVAYVMDLIDPHVRLYLRGISDFHDRPSWFAENWKKYRCEGNAELAKKIDNIFERAAEDNCERFELPMHVRKKQAQVDREVYHIRKESKKLEYHPSAWQLLWQAKEQAEFLQKKGQKEVSQYLSNSLKGIPDMEAFRWKVLVAMQGLYYEEWNEEPPRVGAQGEKISMQMCISFLTECAQWEVQQFGRSLQFGLNHISALDAQHLKIHGWTKMQVVDHFQRVLEKKKKKQRREKRARTRRSK